MTDHTFYAGPRFDVPGGDIVTGLENRPLYLPRIFKVKSHAQHPNTSLGSIYVYMEDIQDVGRMRKIRNFTKTLNIPKGSKERLIKEFGKSSLVFLLYFSSGRLRVAFLFLFISSVDFESLTLLFPCWYFSVHVYRTFYASQAYYMQRMGTSFLRDQSVEIRTERMMSFNLWLSASAYIFNLFHSNFVCLRW